MAGTLSGGEQQMLVIGRSLMSNPKLLMLDEPSLGIAPLVVERIFEVIREINKRGTTILAGGAKCLDQPDHGRAGLHYGNRSDHPCRGG